MDYILIENKINKAKTNPSRELLESIDESFTCMLNTARKKIEGPKRNILFLKEKEKHRSILLY